MLEALSKRTAGKRVLVLGIGNRLRGDDGLGPALIERLRGKVAVPIIDADNSPENYLFDVEKMEPQVLILVDAARLGSKPGDLALLEVEQLAEVVTMTHNTSLALVAKLFQSLTAADVIVLAVQPENTSFGAPLSPGVVATLDSLETMLVRLGNVWKTRP